MHELPAGLNLNEAERIWVTEVGRRLAAGESVDERAIKVALRFLLPTEFKLSDIRRDLWSNGKLSIAGLSLVLPNEPLVTETDLILRATSEILVEDPTRNEIRVEEISARARLARIIHEGRLMSLSSGRIELVMARGGADDASFGFPALTRGDFGTAMSA